MLRSCETKGSPTLPLTTDYATTEAEIEEDAEIEEEQAGLHSVDHSGPF